MGALLAVRDKPVLADTNQEAGVVSSGIVEQLYSSDLNLRRFCYAQRRQRRCSSAPPPFSQAYKESSQKQHAGKRQQEGGELTPRDLMFLVPGHREIGAPAGSGR